MAHHRHKREPNARRLVALTGSRAARIAAGAALATTLPAVALGVARRRPCRPARAGGRTRSARSSSTPPATTRSRSPGPSTARRPAASSRASRPRRPRSAPSSTPTSRSGRPPTSTSGRARPRRPARSGSCQRASTSWSPAASTDGRAEVVVDGQSRWVTAELPRRPEARSRLRRGRGVTAAAGLSMAPVPRRLGGVPPDLGRRLRLPLGVPRLPADHVVRRLGRPRRARHRQGARHHDQRRRPRQRDRGVPPAARLRAAPLRHPVAPAHLDPGPGLRGLAAVRRPRVSRRPTTWTTCTCRSTDRRPARGPVAWPRLAPMPEYDDAARERWVTEPPEAGPRARAHAVRARPGAGRARRGEPPAGRQDPGGRAAERRLRPQPAHPQPRGRPDRARPGPGARLRARHRRDGRARPRPRPPAVRAQRRAGPGRAQPTTSAASRATPRRCAC